MKTCYRCKENKPSAEYGKNQRKADGLAIICKDCKRQYDRDYHAANAESRRASVREKYQRVSARNRQYVLAYLQAHPCVDCGEKDVVVLEFDHVRGKKIKNVSDMVSRQWSLDMLKAEIEKCKVRCANDHRRVTHQRRLVAAEVG